MRKRRKNKRNTLMTATLALLVLPIFTAVTLIFAVIGTEAREIEEVPGITLEPIQNDSAESATVSVAATTPSVSDSEVQAVIRHFEGDDVSVPILIDYIGMWIDQHGEKMFQTDAEWYFKAHPDYCAAALAANRKLNKHPVEMDDPGDEYDRLEQILAGYGPARGSYPFLKERIAEFCEDGTHILMAMSPYQIETVEAYIGWTSYEPELVPILHAPEGWVNQFGEEFSDNDAKTFFSEHPGYEAVAEEYTKAARDTGMIPSVNVMQAKIAYSSWFMFQARQANGITEKEFTHAKDDELIRPLDELWDIETLTTHLIKETEKLYDWHKS